jgi:hypothetical protein
MAERWQDKPELRVMLVRLDSGDKRAKPYRHLLENGYQFIVFSKNDYRAIRSQGREET